jgi:hypothetical protein
MTLDEHSSYDRWRKTVDDLVNKLEGSLTEIKGSTDVADKEAQELRVMVDELVKDIDKESAEQLYGEVLKLRFITTPIGADMDLIVVYEAVEGVLELKKSTGEVKEEEYQEGLLLLKRARLKVRLIDAQLRLYQEKAERALELMRLIHERVRDIRQSEIEKQTSSLNVSLMRMANTTKWFTVGIFAATSLVIALEIIRLVFHA